MKRYLHFTLLILTVLLLAGCQNAGAPQIGLPSVAPEKVGLSTERLERIDKVMQQYVDEGRIAGAVTLVARRGKVAHLGTYGMADIEAGKPMQANTIFRIASMTKPITSVAVMMLYEEGHFLLSDPISKYIPEFKNPQVLVPSSTGDSYTTVPAKAEITIRQLLSHTSGISYLFFGREYIADLYQNASISDGLTQTEGTIGDNVRRLAGLPLYSQPGEAWGYGLSVDVLGYFIEVISGMSLDGFFRERIFKPLRMEDTYFYLPEDKISRLASLYRPVPEGGLDEFPETPVEFGYLVMSSTYHYSGPRTYYSGGGGLVSTASDYARFLQMMMNGGELEGVRLLSRKTVETMTTNHIGDLRSLWFGNKFSLGFGIYPDPGESGTLNSEGSYSWGGIFNTGFGVDPQEELIGIIMTQLYPNNQSDITAKFPVLAYQAIVN